MIFKFINPNFEIDLLDYQIDITKENQWFSSSLFVEYSLPVEIDLDEDYDKAFGLISHINAHLNQKVFDGKIFIGNEIREAKLILISIKRKLKIKFKFGYEQFPNFGKKLKELPLEIYNLEGESIYQHALNKLNASYLESNYVFPQAIPPKNKFNTSSEDFESFLGLINNYKNNAFVENTFNVAEAKSENKNIMQPMPYLIHVLKKGFEDVGFTLSGDILMDDKVLKSVITEVSDYYTQINSDQYEWIVNPENYQSIDRGPNSSYFNSPAIYYSEFIPDTPGLYRVAGNNNVRTALNIFSDVGAFNSRLYWSNLDGVSNILSESYSSIDVFLFTKNIDIYIQVSQANIDAGHKLVFESKHLPYANNEDYINDVIDPINVLDLTFTKLAGYDSNGDYTNTLVEPSIVDLTKVVPDVSFGDLVKAVLIWRNMDITVSDSVVYINKVSKVINKTVTTSLENHNVQYPTRNFQEEKKLLLKYEDVESEDYTYDQVMVTSQGFFINDINEEEITDHYVINLLPLPLKQFEGEAVIDVFLENNSKIKLMLYDGLQDGQPNGLTNQSILIPSIYQDCYTEWFSFMLNSTEFMWTITLPIDQAFKLSVYEKFVAYQMKHLSKQLQIKKRNRNYADITLTTAASY